MNDLTIYGQMCALAAYSPVHRKWAVSEAARLFMPPIVLRQFFMLEDGSAFATWGWLSKEVSDGWINRTRKLMPDDWKSGDSLWFMDFIAPFGNAKTLIRELRKIFPATVGYGTRSFGSKRVQRITRWANVA